MPLGSESLTGRGRAFQRYSSPRTSTGGYQSVFGCDWRMPVGSLPLGVRSLQRYSATLLGPFGRTKLQHIRSKRFRQSVTWLITRSPPPPWVWSDAFGVTMQSGPANPEESPAFGFLPEPRPLGSVAIEGDVRFDDAKSKVCLVELFGPNPSSDKTLSP